MRADHAGKSKNIFMFILCICIISSLGMVGASYAAWRDGNDVAGALSAGSMDIKVTDIEVSDEDRCNVASTTGGGITLAITEAASGYEMTCKYSVRNKGTIPVRCEREDDDLPQGVEISFDKMPEIIDVGEKENGQFKLSIGDACEAGKTYVFNIPIVFRQWNAVE